MKYTRICPKCKGIVYHKNEANRNRAEKEGRTCGGKANLNCKIISEKQKRQLSKMNTGIIFSSSIRRKKTYKSKYFRKCSTCNKILYYCSVRALKYAERDKRICDRCRIIKTGKQWKNIITTDMIHQMRATKAGFSTWEEYLKKYPKKKQYQSEVRRLTNKQPLHILTNIDKRGLCGKKRAYQLDHIISIEEGWRNGIQAEKIAHISNLQCIPWKVNRTKSAN